MLTSRSSGLLLHITSLPGDYGSGDLGPHAYRFADFLADARQHIWQVLPLVPTGLGNSPYSSPSTFAGNPLLISIGNLIERGLVQPEEADPLRSMPDDYVDFGRLIPLREELLSLAHRRFEEGLSDIDRGSVQHFVSQNSDWLDDYALFMALKEHFDGVSWTEWPDQFRKRDPDALGEFKVAHEREIRRHIFGQYLFHEQWTALKNYCNARGIRIFGDLPIYVALDSADVWSHPELYYLDETYRPTVVAGVPPDYFAETGQRWGNPLYRWDVMRDNGYAWWKRRMTRMLEHVDIVRLDHFRAFDAYWEIPETEPTAVNGQWMPGPGADFFYAMQQSLGELPLVAEDLGIITDSVRELMDHFGLPGMAVLQFGFDSGPSSTFLPHNFKRNQVVYTGTHDNDTLMGWWTDNRSTISTDEAAASREFARRYLDLQDGDEVHWKAIRTLLMSVAQTAIVTVQDVLGLGSEARMNTPGIGEGNWTWRLKPSELAPDHAARLAELVEISGRTV